MTPTQRQKVRKEIAAYCVASERNQPSIHYSQRRPMTHLGVAPAHGFTADCSGHVTGAYYWAHVTTGIGVTDPNARHYDGYGWTGSLYAVNHEHPAPANKYLVGDIALFGPSVWDTKHVVICRTKGDSTTSVWTSHGSERGPYPVRLHYRTDLLAVLRPASLL